MIGCLARINENILNIQEKGMFLGEKRGQCFGYIYIPIYMLYLLRVFCGANPVGSTLYVVSHLILTTTQGNKRL